MKAPRIQLPTTLKDLIYDNIKMLFNSGQIHPDEIYSAKYFAEMLGVSRTPVREALLQLASEGFMVAVKGRGFKTKTFSEKEISDFFETRKMIEGYVIERLVYELTKSDFSQLGIHLKTMRKTAKKESAQDFIEADKCFHMALIKRYGNHLLESIVENIRSLISIFGSKALSYEGRYQEVVNEHEMVLKALYDKEKDKAVAAMNYHLDTTERYLLEVPATATKR